MSVTVDINVPANENQPLLSTSTSSKRVTIAEPDDVDKVPSTPKRSRDAPPPIDYSGGVYIMLFITFLSSICFSIVLPSIWPFMHDKFNSKPGLVGWAVAVNSAGSFLASPLFGGWADKRTTREVLAATLILNIIGNLMYSMAQNVYMLLAGRFVVGVAAANYAVAQTYISYATTPETRTKVMALNSAANVLGFIVGPALALVFTFMHFHLNEISFDDYTLPGYFSSLLCLLSLLSLIFLKEIQPSTKRAKGTTGSGSGIYDSSKYSHSGSGFYSGGGSVKDISQIIKVGKKAQIPWLPVIVCLFSYFAYTASFTVFETIGTPYTQADFNWGVTQNSILYAILGGICIISLVILQILVRFLNDRVLLILFTGVMVTGFGILFTYNDALVGLPRFSIGVSLTGGGYAVSVAVLISIYSKTLESLDQGMMMGWLSSGGSVARIIGPIFASYSFQFGGGRLVFGTMAAMMFVLFVLLIVSYRILAPRTKTENAINE